jgi:hypothetical protein
MSSEPNAQPTGLRADAKKEGSGDRRGQSRGRETGCASVGRWCGSPDAIRTTFLNG